MARFDHPAPAGFPDDETDADEERRRRGVLVGMGYLALAGLVFAIFSACVHWLASELHPAEAAFIRYLFGCVIMLPLFIGASRKELMTRRPFLHIARGFLHGAGVLLWFYALANISLAEVTALTFTSPVWATVGAVLILGEQAKLRRFAAVFLGLLGALIVLFGLPTDFQELRESFSVLGLGQAAILVAAPLFACSKIMTKQLTETESTKTIVIWLSITLTVMLAIPAIAVWRWPTPEEWFGLAMVAILATLAHFLMTQAWRAADLSVTQPVEFLQLVWASLIGIYLFGETPTAGIWIGGAVIVGSATYIAHREAVIRRQGRAAKIHAEAD